MTDQPTPRIKVTDRAGKEHLFASTGLHEDYEFSANVYTNELTVSRVKFGPRGTDEWARLGTVVVAAWGDGQWASVTQFA
jgi:hypothetical protein